MNPAMRDLFLGGEDEEVQDFTPPRPALRAERGYLLVNVVTEPDGSATVWYETNDRDNDGVPDRQSTSWDEIIVSWSEKHESAEAARRAVGGSGVEASGRLVVVYHDGRPIS